MLLGLTCLPLSNSARANFLIGAWASTGLLLATRSAVLHGAGRGEGASAGLCMQSAQGGTLGGTPS